MIDKKAIDLEGLNTFLTESDSRYQKKFGEAAENSPKSLYNLGAYDTYVDNGDGTVTVTRKTGYISTQELVGLNWSKAPMTYSYPTFFTDGDSATSTVNNAVMNGGLTFLQGVWENSNTFCVREYSDSVRVDISLSDSESSWSVEDFLAWISQNSVYIEYERPSNYTERLLKKTPLNNLDANMMQIVRNEVEKTLNLFSGVWEQGTFDPEGGEVYIAIRVRSTKMRLDAGTYSISLSGADDKQVYIFNDDGTLKDELDWLEGNTFTLSESGIISIACRKSDNSDISPEDIQNTMLVKGTRAYAYQPYNGAIVHEKQLPRSSNFPITSFLAFQIYDKNFIVFPTVDGKKVAILGFRLQGNSITIRSGTQILSHSMKLTRTHRGLGAMDYNDSAGRVPIGFDLNADGTVRIYVQSGDNSNSGSWNCNGMFVENLIITLDEGESF